MTTRSIVLGLGFAIAALAAGAARADDVNGAARAFSQAQEAMLGGDTARAADLYELADELSPSAPALRNATRARLAAGHLAMAATNAAALLRRYPTDKDAREMAEAMLSQLSPQLAQLEVTCTAPCTLLIDGKVVASVARPQHGLFIQPGARTVTAVFGDGRKASSQLTAAAGRTASVPLEPPAVPAAPRSGPSLAAHGRAALRPAPSRGLSRWWVLGGAVITVGAGAATIASGMTTLSTRDQIRDASAAGDDPRARTLYNTGRDQQIRTNVLLGATAVAGIGTVVFAILADWSPGRSERDLAIAPGRDGASLVYSGRF